MLVSLFVWRLLPWIKGAMGEFLRQIQIIFLFFVFLITTSSLFQNCSKMEANVSKSIVTPPPPPSPGTSCSGSDVRNRPIPLDNKGKSLNPQGVLEDVVYSVGGVDIFYYETKQVNACKSTLVTIENIDGEIKLSVDSDDCAESKILTSGEQTELTNLINQSLSNLRLKEPGDRDLGCSFPRFVVNSQSDGGSHADFEIYFSSSVNCVPNNELFVSDIDSNGQSDPQVLELMNNMEDFFEGQIDLACQGS